ncbi:hypothetical protein MHYP_G00169580 [Metynnis hypsauchen]
MGCRDVYVHTTVQRVAVMHLTGTGRGASLLKKGLTSCCKSSPALTFLHSPNLLSQTDHQKEYSGGHNN